MNILILGGTGLVGQALHETLQDDHQVQAFGRGIYSSTKLLTEKIEWSDILIQLSGASVAKRWTARYKQEIWDSRIKTNQQLVDIFSTLKNKPKLIFASAVGYYPESYCDAALDESCSGPGSDYLSLLSTRWEELAKEISNDALIFRFGVVLSKKAGALKEMLPMYKLGLGGPIGSGKQCFPWIYIKDLVRAFSYGINKDLSGIYNLTSPDLITQKTFGKAFAKTLRRPFYLTTFEWQLKLIFGEGSQVLTKSLAIKPTKLSEQGFIFKYPKIENTLKDIFNN